jgi:HEPN domain-containing protein
MTALDLAKEWLRYAQSDLHTANRMFFDVAPKETEICCYHAQQCAEKALKSFLIAKETDPPRTHDLLELNQLCTLKESNFSSIQQYCALLNPYGVQVRYPNEFAVDDATTQAAITNAERIFSFCGLLLSRADSSSNPDQESEEDDS